MMGWSSHFVLSSVTHAEWCQGVANVTTGSSLPLWQLGPLQALQHRLGFISSCSTYSRTQLVQFLVHSCTRQPDHRDLRCEFPLPFPHKAAYEIPTRSPCMRGSIASSDGRPVSNYPVHNLIPGGLKCFNPTKG
ncbi:hypothetical protein F5883DRAFT_578957 [Diaporthe sp. PMI_573]|nr:hypothetical protein F5883DRAFT_578957 [Diaporthaceae sp. PMI_573]